MEVIYSNDLMNGYINNKNFIGFFGEQEDLTSIISNLETVKIKPNSKVKKVISNNTEYLNLLNLSESILNKKIKELSYSEYKLIMLIKISIMHPNIIILNNFDLGLNYKVKSKVSRFIKTINATFHTNFIIISNDVLFINKNAKHIIISRNKIIKYQGDLITAIRQNKLPKPPILEFIDLANEQGAKLTDTLDSKELLKDIYRSVF